MADREIIRENHISTSGDAGTNLLIGIVVAILIGLIIYFIATGRFNFAGQQPTNGSIDVNLNTPSTNNGGATDTNGTDTNTTTP